MLGLRRIEVSTRGLEGRRIASPDLVDVDGLGAGLDSRQIDQDADTTALLDEDGFAHDTAVRIREVGDGGGRRGGERGKRQAVDAASVSAMSQAPRCHAERFTIGGGPGSTRMGRFYATIGMAARRSVEAHSGDGGGAGEPMASVDCSSCDAGAIIRPRWGSGCASCSW
jgi:hypothetical protein